VEALEQQRTAKQGGSFAITIHVRTVESTLKSSSWHFGDGARRLILSFSLPKDPSVAEKDPRPPALEAVRDKIVDKTVFLITHVLYVKR